MSAETIPQVCAVCRATSDREPMVNTGEYHPYWLCINRAACTNRATAQQHEAAEAVRRAIEAEQAALRAEVAEARAAVLAEGTGPLKAITDAAVSEMTEMAAAGGDEGKACHD